MLYSFLVYKNNFPTHYAVILNHIWRETDHWARSYEFLKTETFHEKWQTYFRKMSYGKVNENCKFQNFDFFEKIKILKFSIFIDFSIGDFSKISLPFYMKSSRLQEFVAPTQWSVCLKIWFKMTAWCSSRWENCFCKLKTNTTKVMSK